MGQNRWRGDAAAVAQVETFTVGSSTAAQTFGVTINGKTISYTAGGSETTSTIAAALQALLADQSAPPEFQEVAWTVSTNVITATAAAAGVPFTTAAAGTGTLTKATVTASSGPSHADTAANWSTGVVPAATDDVVIDGGSDVLYGLNNVTTPALNSFRVKASFDGQVGLPRWNAAGYYEYRTRTYPVATTVPVTIGEGDGTGPTLVNISSGATLAMTVIATGGRQSQSAFPVVNVSGCSGGTLSVVSGDVGVGADDDSVTPTVATVTIGGGTLTVGKGATATTVNMDGGAVKNFGTVTTLTAVAGTFTHSSGNTITTVTADPAPDSTLLFDWRCGGTITTATFRGQGGGQNAPRMDCSSDPRAKTITNGTFTGGAVLNDPDKTTTWTNAQTWDRESLSGSDLGSRFTLSRT